MLCHVNSMYLERRMSQSECKSVVLSLCHGIIKDSLFLVMVTVMSDSSTILGRSRRPKALYTHACRCTYAVYTY